MFYLHSEKNGEMSPLCTTCETRRRDGEYKTKQKVGAFAGQFDGYFIGKRVKVVK